MRGSTITNNHLETGITSFSLGFSFKTTKPSTYPVLLLIGKLMYYTYENKKKVRYTHEGSNIGRGLWYSH
jgi:hypothetical protein